MKTKARGQQIANNLSAILAPTVNDDVTLGYYVESQWFDTVTNILYICTDNTTGAAVWNQVSGSGGGSAKYNSGTFQQAGNSTVSTVIPHGFGAVPTHIKITSLGAQNVAFDTIDSTGTYDGTNTHTIYHYLSAGGGFLTSAVDAVNIINLIFDAGGIDQSATVTIDATNITLTWTVNGGGVGQNQSFLWEAFILGGSSVIPTVQVFTASGTYTKPAGLVYVVAEAVGGGGGADGSGNGGGGGGYSKKIIDAALIGATETVTVGAGGTEGVSGGDSSFGAFITADKGLTPDGSSIGHGGLASGGDLNIGGSDGTVNDSFATSSGGSGMAGGNGGNSFYGGGGGGAVQNNQNGRDGLPYGGGGGGAEGAGTGGSGFDGVVIITEYYS